MILRVVRESVRRPAQEAGHFIVSNYETYNQTRYTERYGKRYAERYKIKEVVKEGFKEVEKKDTQLPSADGDRVSPKILFEIYQQQNQSLP
jgi:hypothetical protein